MPGAPTANLALVMPTHNEFVGSWDSAAANPNYQTIDNALGGLVGVGVSSAWFTLTADQAAHMIINFSGSLANDVVVNFPGGVGGHKFIRTADVAFNGHGLYLRSPTDPYGILFLAPWNPPIPIFVWPGWKVMWDYSSAQPGTVIDYAGYTVPPGWLACDGQWAVRAQYELLFNAIGTGYGAADGSVYFAVPDLRGRVVAAADTMFGGASAGRLYNVGIGWPGGESSHVLSLAEMPAHDHGFTESAHNHVLHDPGHVHDSNWRVGGYFGVGNFAPYKVEPGGGYLNTGGAGTGMWLDAAWPNIGFGAQGAYYAHNNVQPTFTLNKIIRC